jgi:hypothetical protein
METLSEKAILSELAARFTEPAKYKIKAYQLTALMYIDHILTLVVSKYLFIKVKLVEKKANLNLVRFQQSQVKLLLETLVAKDKLKTSSLVLIKHIKHKTKKGFGMINLFSYLLFFLLLNIEKF